MTARMTTRLPKGRITGLSIALQDPVDGQLWERLAESWPVEVEAEIDPSDYRKQQIESRLAEDEAI